MNTLIKSLIRTGVVMATAGATYHIGKNVGTAVGETVKEKLESLRLKNKKH